MMAAMQRPFWFARALADDPGVLPPLVGETSADVCVVGGGYTGLWTALQIKQQAPQLDVVMLEADTCGAGASGRNGGCMLSWATKFLTLQRLFGESEAVRLVHASEDAIGKIEAFTRKHAIDCDLRRDGVLFTARARHHDKGQVGIEALDHRQRFVAAEAGHVVIGNHHIEPAFGQRLSQIVAGVHASHIGQESLAAELQLQQPGIVLGILNHQNVYRSNHEVPPSLKRAPRALGLHSDVARPVPRRAIQD